MTKALHPSKCLTRPLETLALFAWMLIALPSTLSAQTQVEPTTLQGNIITQELQRDVFVRPGLGLKQVQIGHSFAHVVRTWGAPDSDRTRGILGRTREWRYSAGDGTQLIVSGKKAVDTMIVRGSVTSPYQTVEGARFGMAPYQVTAFYTGTQFAQSDQRLEFPTRGVSFEFHQGAMKSIEVYRPRSP